MDQPLISVIVPVYRVEAYLDRCLRSLTGQTYHNLEIILIDDGSPDRSGAICDAWAEQDDRIRVIHQDNRGSGAARNAGLDVARGELIGFVDSDDYVSPDFYQYLENLLEDRDDIAECSWLETQADDIEFDHSPRLATRFTPQEAMLGNIQDTVFRQLIWNKLYRREVLSGVRFPLEKTGIDDEFFTYRCLAKARSLIRSDKALYAYRQQPDSVMHRPYSLQRLNGIRAKRQRLSFLRETMPQLEGEARRELLLACLYAMQGALEHLQEDDLEEARAFLHSTADELTPVPTRGLPLKKRLLLTMAASDLEKTARRLNLLIRLHILT